MLHGVFLRIFEQTSELAYDSPLYNWSLRSGDAPPYFLFLPVDIRPGDRNKAQALCDGHFLLGPETTPVTECLWKYPEDRSENWRIYLESFGWLRDLRSLGTSEARRQARALMTAWIHANRKWRKPSWEAGILGARLSNWLSCYNFYGASADDRFQQEMMQSFVSQAKHLARAANAQDCQGTARLYALKGLIFAGLSLPARESWVIMGVELLEDELQKQILSDGGHVSRNPRANATLLQLIYDIQSALQTAGYPCPTSLPATIDRMAQALRFFRYPDRGLAVFHNGGEGDRDHIEHLLQKTGQRNRTVSRLPQSGFARLTCGRSVLMMDVGLPPKYPEDIECHASPTAFEFCYGKERIIVNCGAHAASDEWRALLRGSPAHSMVTLDHRNACEIKANGHIGRKPNKLDLKTAEDQQGRFIETAHDGYALLNGITHTRRVYLTNGGHHLIGEERLSCASPPAKPASVAVRFHLHPQVKAGLTQDGATVLLRLAGRAGWRFTHRGGLLALEDSVYLGQDGAPRKTKQIVIYGEMASHDARLNWSLKRETA